MAEPPAPAETSHAVRSTPTSGRRRAFVAVVAGAAVVVGSYTTLAIRRARRPAPDLAAVSLPAPPSAPYLVVRSTAPDATFRRLLLVPLGDPAGASFVTDLECDRAYVAGPRGVCLSRGSVLGEHYAEIFDARFQRVFRLPLSGLPSRTRVSPDGRLAGITVFEQGHSYAEDGFSTRTSIVDTMASREIADLEQFAIWRDGVRFRAVDFNFWGVTFAADSNRFFVTLDSGGVKYLVEGFVDRREGHVVRSGVECPSLSPDNTRIAFKHLLGQAGDWQLRIYDLRSGGETVLETERRSVDDQVDWLDDDHIMYHLAGSRGADLWALRADGTEPPRLLREYAYSPAVVR